MMKKVLFVFFAFFFLTFLTNLNAQDIKDTLEMAKQLRENNKIPEALKLLEKYQAKHTEDLNTAWLCAQTAYWIKHFKTAERYYEKAIQIDPHNPSLLLDYDLMLVNSGNLAKAKPLLRTFYSWDPTNIQVLIALAEISLWQCDYNDAEWFINKILAYDTKNKRAVAIEDEILAARSPWGKISITHNSDDQSLKTTTPSFEGGFYKSALSIMHFNFQIPTFITDNKKTNAWWFQAGNKFVLNKQNLEINIDLGLMKFPSSNNASFKGNLQLNKTIINHLIISAQVERKPYFYTISSLNNVVIDNHYSISTAWSELNNWNGKTAFDLDHFNDKNSISTFSAWCMSPPIKVSIAEFHIGYGINFSNSKENHFVEKALTYVYDSTEHVYPYKSVYTPVITGIYNPYFTPAKQLINAVIVSVAIHPLKSLNFSAKISYGFYAFTQCPYLYLNKDANDNAYISKDYFKEKYSPVDFNISAAWKLTKKIDLKAEYTYSNTNYYKNHYLGLGVKMSFWNENK